MKSLETSYQIKVLLVEDQPIAQKIAKMILNTLNCELKIAESGEKAIECFRQAVYDLILMDIGLPDKDGFKITLEMRGIEKKNYLKATPIIGLSVHTAEIARNQAIEAGMNGYFVKPLTLDMFQSILNQFVISPRLLAIAPTSD